MEILLIFKTHLDLGYTDLAAEVERRYMEDFIPHALDLAESMKDSDEKFIWTTGSWLIDRFLQTSESNRIRMENAIRDGLISWHALPFTMHAEMMNAPLYERGLAISARLDARFGRKTIAAKATDVPGMTKAVIPFLEKSGVKLLHVGVNPASAVPDVPSVFRWRCDGSEIIVIYDKNYGGLTELPGTDAAICFAMTNDNHGPQSPEDIRALYAELRERYPGANIRAATLTEVAELLVKANPELPVITDEIGDSWAHGYQVDPYKQAAYRAMLRFAETRPETEKNAMLDQLLLIAEHTCGVCQKRYLNDDGNYARADFERERVGENYKFCERSWREQRAYVDAAIAVLPEDAQKLAEAELEKCTKAVEISGKTVPNGLDMYIGADISLGNYQLKIGYDGAIYHIRKDGRELTPPHAKLFAFEYEVYSKGDTLRFCEQYFKERVSWGYDDFDKRGLEKTGTAHLTCGAFVDKINIDGDTLYAELAVEELVRAKYGCPKRLILKVTAEESGLRVEFSWSGKPALRIPEGLWLTCDSLGEGISVRKLGRWIDPTQVVYNGGRILHGTDYGVRLGGIEIETLDCALLTFGGDLWNYTNMLPASNAGVRFNLYNNQWNTNFPMWYEEDACFRFIVR